MEGQLPGHASLAKEIKSWLISAERPLTIQELQHALAVEIGTPELDEENITLPSRIIDVCAGIVTIDEESRIVRLVHYTAQQYFEQIQPQWIPDALSTIFMKCSSYLQSEPLAATNATIHSPDLQDQNHLLEYVSGYWDQHVATFYSSSTHKLTERETILCLRVLRNKSCTAWIMRWFRYWVPNFLGYPYLPALHFAALFGLPLLYEDLLQGTDVKTSINVKAESACGMTPLALAAFVTIW